MIGPTGPVLRRVADVPGDERVRRADEEQARAPGRELRGGQDRDRADLRRPDHRGPGQPGRAPGNVGYIKNYNPYPDNNGNGDPAKSKALLAKAGFPNGVPIKLLYSTNDPGPRVAQALQASLNAGGFKVTLVSATQSDSTEVPARASTAKATCGIGAAWLDPGLVREQRPLGRAAAVLRPGQRLERLQRLQQPHLQRVPEQGADRPVAGRGRDVLAKANAQIMKDAATVPVEFQKYTAYHSSRVQGCTFFFRDLNCDPTNVWLKG